MMPIISALTDSGIHVLRLSLRGHGKNYDHRLHLQTDEARLESFKGVSYRQWINEARRAYWQVKEQGKQEKVPVFLAAFSVGGLLGLDLFAATPGVQFDKMVLFAPAIRLYALLYLGRLLSPFPRLVLPSLGPETYLSNKKGTPVAAYNAVFQGLARFKAHVSQKINVPALVFVDGKDEFIPLRGLKNLVAKNHLDQWRFYGVRKGESADSSSFHHHIIDLYSTGEDVWQQIKAAMAAHLLGEAPN
jgi:alpha-beta hydrolase superfamily lysophospholipase